MLADKRGLAAVTEGLAEIADGPTSSPHRRPRISTGERWHIDWGSACWPFEGRETATPVHRQTYSLEYGTATLEIPAEGLDLRDRRVVIIDDVLATGGTVVAARELLVASGAIVTAAAVVLELAALRGRDKIAPLAVSSLHII